ncbi:hypothetical protein BC829DRAFT_432092 [Chytridium lagenaria]|nr:hypothetical protein BC829DRAFT_432092 [Chytridium lagenaria]
MNGIDDGPGPAVVPAYLPLISLSDEGNNRTDPAAPSSAMAGSIGQINLRSAAADEARWDIKRFKKHCKTVILEAAEDHGIQPHRMIYAMAGRVFVVTAPKPIGGKPSPGFKKFRGETPEELASWILDKAVEPPLSGRGRKKVPPGTILRFIIGQINELLRMKKDGEKDAFDDVVLKGMFRSGHLPETGGKIVLPEYLRDKSLAHSSRATTSLYPERTQSNSPGKNKTSRPRSESHSEDSEPPSSKKKRNRSDDAPASSNTSPEDSPSIPEKYQQLPPQPYNYFTYGHGYPSYSHNPYPHYPYPPPFPDMTAAQQRPNHSSTSASNSTPSSSNSTAATSVPNNALPPGSSARQGNPRMYGMDQGYPYPPYMYGAYPPHFQPQVIPKTEDLGGNDGSGEMNEKMTGRGVVRLGNRCLCT